MDNLKIVGAPLPNMPLRRYESPDAFARRF